jgi:hypothetical protein
MTDRLPTGEPDQLHDAEHELMETGDPQVLADVPEPP